MVCGLLIASIRVIILATGYRSDLAVGRFACGVDGGWKDGH